jgi:hypothetical protein
MYFYKLLLEPDARFKLNLPETIVFGWEIDKPTLFLTNEDGYLCFYPNIRSQDFCNFVINCSTQLNRTNEGGADQVPLCIAKNEESFFCVRSIDDANNLWYKSLSKKKQILIQRYICSSSFYACTYRVYWSSMKTRAVRFTNSQPMFSNRDMKPSFRNLLLIDRKIGSRAESFRKPRNQTEKYVSLENRFLINETDAATAEILTLDPGLEEQARCLNKILHKTVCIASNYEVSDFTADFIQGEDSKWYFMELKSYSTVRKRSHAVIAKNPFLKSEISPKSPLPISYSRPQTQERPKRPRQNTRKKSCPPQGSVRPKSVSYNGNAYIPFLAHTPSINISDTPALHAAKSPQNSSHQLYYMTRLNSSNSQSLLSSPIDCRDPNLKYQKLKCATQKLLDYSKEERISKIRNVLAIQNDSMSIRLHYEQEFSKDKETLEMAQKSINSVVDLYNKTAARAGWLDDIF